jgi:hypothetical protein
MIAPLRMSFDAGCSAEHDWGEATVWNPPTRLENPAPALPGSDRRSRPAEILMSAGSTAFRPWSIRV